MAKQLINVGTSANSRTGDNLRTAFIKINDNFNEVFDAIANGTGVIGHDGKSAYELAVEHGFTGTIDQWLISLRGIHGTDGTNGTNGTNGINGTNGRDGVNGKSAYELAVQEGFVGTLQEWLASLHGGGGSTSGAVFISDVTSTSGTISTKVFSNAGKVLESFTTDTQTVTVTVFAMTGSSSYVPVITVNTIPVTLSEITFGQFTGTVDITLNNSATITAHHVDGPSDFCAVTYDTPASILTGAFTGGYPGTQTELKAGDTFQFHIIASLPFIAIEIADYGAFTAQSFTVASTTNTTITGIIANRGNTIQSLGAKVRVQKASGSWSAYYLSTSIGTTDGVNTVQLNNVAPTITIGSVTYPGSQQALKNTESATVTNTVTNADVITYSSPNNELTIPSPTQYSSAKTVTRAGGTYNISTNNFRIVAVRSANNSSTTANGIVQIANTACTVAVTESSPRLMSGGSNGTSAQNYTITITANQNLLSAPTLAAGAQGTFIGTGFTGSGTNWTRSIQITDTMTKGTYTWGAISATNLAGIATTTITGDNLYTLGGFVARTITLDAYANEASIAVAVTDYSKLTMTWNVKALPNKRAVGTTAVPDANSWTISALNTNPTTIRILDVAATLASSTPSTITIQETA